MVGMGRAAWFTVATEINTGNGWRPIHDPFYTAAEDPQDLIEDTVRDYELEDVDGEWIVRIYEGLRFETVVASRASGEHNPNCNRAAGGITTQLQRQIVVREW
jgi:hypothetical protein